MKKFQGIDAGSTYTKSTIIDVEGNILEQKKMKSRFWKDAVTEETKCATGYFRKLIDADFKVTEISAAIVGVRKFFPNVEMIIDIGGQDVKVIDIPNNDMIMNDRCSAGTGAFLDLLAEYLGLDNSEMEEYHRKSTERSELNNTCAVFVLSEVISAIARGSRTEDIVAGIHYSFARRIKGLLKNGRDNIAVIGGVALNGGLISALEDVIGRKVYVPDNAQSINSIGAAEIARRRFNDRTNQARQE